MNPTDLSREIAFHEALKQQLLTVYGEDIDEEALLDSLEGECDVVEIITKIVRQARADEAMVEAIKLQQDALAKRKERFKQRAEKLRNVALDAMERTGRKKIEAPDFTVSLGKSPVSVLITDERALPEDFLVWKSSPDKKAIREALEARKEVPGAILSNGGARLTVRTA